MSTPLRMKADPLSKLKSSRAALKSAMATAWAQLDKLGKLIVEEGKVSGEIERQRGHLNPLDAPSRKALLDLEGEQSLLNQHIETCREREVSSATDSLAQVVNSAWENYLAVVRIRLDQTSDSLLKDLRPYCRDDRSAQHFVDGLDCIAVVRSHVQSQLPAGQRGNLCTATWLASLIDQAITNPSWLPWSNGSGPAPIDFRVAPQPEETEPEPTAA